MVCWCCFCFIFVAGFFVFCLFVVVVLLFCFVIILFCCCFVCLFRFKCCFTSTETAQTVSDGKPRTATPTLTQLLSYDSFVAVVDRFYTAPFSITQRHTQRLSNSLTALLSHVMSKVSKHGA